jgi:ABC-type nitrate/sulfonate/bicarbonate transport system permease component
MLLNAIRSIPGLIWALIAVAVLGANAGAGVAALAIYSLGYLGKFFSDAFESADPSVSQALRAGGASRLQAFQYGIWPHAAPLAWSHTLWMLEYNIRSASIVGYVGAGGIGVWLHTYQEFYEWDKFAAVLACILAAVVILDLCGSRLRRTLAPTAPRFFGSSAGSTRATHEPARFAFWNLKFGLVELPESTRSHDRSALELSQNKQIFVPRYDCLCVSG